MTIPTTRAIGRLAVTVPIAAALLAVGLTSSPTVEGSTAGQVAQGRAVYQQSCLFCHGFDLQGSVGPALAGAGARITNLPSAQALYDYVSVAMPLSAPGSLSADDYWAVTAFLISENGGVADGVPLGPDNAASVPIGPGAPPAAVEPAPEAVEPAPEVAPVDEAPATEPEAIPPEEAAPAAEPSAEGTPAGELVSETVPYDEPIFEPTAAATTVDECDAAEAPVE